MGWRETVDVQEEHRQCSYRVRVDWGLDGAVALGAGADVVVVVDVLSFKTTLSVALDAGVTVLPYRWKDETAADYAQQYDAVLGVGRSQARPGQTSLSPLSLRTGSAPARVVLSSPNGSTIAHHLSAGPGVCSSGRPGGRGGSRAPG